MQERRCLRVCNDPFLGERDESDIDDAREAIARITPSKETSPDAKSTSI